MARVRTQEVVPLAERLRSAFSLEGLDVEVQETPPTPMSSMEGDPRGVIVLVTSKLSELGRVLVDDADARVKKLLMRLHDEWPDPFRVLARGRDGGLVAAIEPDLPPKAFLRLQGRLPAAPSGRIVYDRHMGRWQDAVEIGGSAEA